MDTLCGPMSALPPEGSLQVLEDMPVKAGGCAANVAIDLARQGIAAEVIGCVGCDSAADVLLNTFETHGIGPSRIVRVGRCATSRTVILLVEGQDRRFLHVTGANSVFTVDHLSPEWLSGLKVFYLGGLFALPGIELEGLARVLEFCNEAKVATVVDVVVPQGFRGMAPLKPLLPLIDVFVPNHDEARAFTGATDPFDQLRALESAGANTVIITRGALGAVAARGGRTWTCGAFQMNVVDPSGSGDAFTSGVIRSFLLGWDLPCTLRYASALGASATRAAGTTDAVFSAAEAEAFVSQHPLPVIEGHGRRTK